MSDVFTESELIFSFPDGTAERWDKEVPHGLKAVDFVVDLEDKLYFIEVKNYEQSKAPIENQKHDLKMLSDSTASYPLEIGMKLKDSLLKRYAMGDEITKPIHFILMLHAPKFEPSERRHLHDRISGYIPTGLNKNEKFSKFTKIEFDLTDIKEMTSKYGFDVSIENNEN